MYNKKKIISELFNAFLYAKTAISCQILTIFDHILKGFGKMIPQLIGSGGYLFLSHLAKLCIGKKLNSLNNLFFLCIFCRNLRIDPTVYVFVFSCGQAAL